MVLGAKKYLQAGYGISHRLRADGITLEHLNDATISNQHAVEDQI